MTLLSMRGVVKTFAGTRALGGVDFDLEAGEIHALLGENGAGKSTLIKILGGALQPDAGEILLDGAPLRPADPRQARRSGIGILHQEFALVPEFTAAENLFLGREPGRPLLDAARMKAETLDALGKLGVALPLDVPVRSLGVAEQQLVEIARALSLDSRVLVLDEPTAALPSADADRLFTVLRTLRGRGLGIVYVTHRLEEVAALADRVTVLRDGRCVATAPAADADRGRIIRWMVGRELSEEFPARTSLPGPVMLEARSLSAPPLFQDASFTVHSGEIVGLAGLVGAGRTPVALALFGALAAQGETLLEGKPLALRSPQQALRAGIAYVTDDRKARGIFPALGAGANVTIASLARFARAGWLSRSREEGATADLMTRFGVRAAGPDQSAGTLSGGNQQKLLLARFLLERRKLLILNEPTRGVDVGARAEIYRLMARLADDGLAILMISSDLPELLGMSDRIVVMRRGRTVGELDRPGATPERVMELAA